MKKIKQTTNISSVSKKHREYFARLRDGDKYYVIDDEYFFQSDGERIPDATVEYIEQRYVDFSEFETYIEIDETGEFSGDETEDEYIIRKLENGSSISEILYGDEDSDANSEENTDVPEPQSDDQPKTQIDKAVYVLEKNGAPMRVKEIRKSIEEEFGKDPAHINGVLLKCSVNYEKRYTEKTSENYDARNSDEGHVHDRLFRTGLGEYEPYDPKKHGVWRFENYKNVTLVEK